MYYKETYPDYFYAVYIDHHVRGYICGAPDTSTDLFFADNHSYLALLKEELRIYPAHLHINLHSSNRGAGLGSLLIKRIEEALGKSKVRGLHIVTDAKARNISFYKSRGFIFTKELVFNKSTLVFMGKSLK